MAADRRLQRVRSTASCRRPAAVMRRLHRVTGILAWVDVVAIVLGVNLAVIPVRTHGVQDCGPPIDYIVGGDFDRLPDSSGRIERGGHVVRLDPAARKRAAEHPCSERVERRAIPAGTLVVVGSLMGLTAMTLAMVRAWRRATSRSPDDTDESDNADKAEVA